MSRNDLPQPTHSLSKVQARRFLLARQHLWPPRQLEGKRGILTYIHHVGAIQFDPINVVGRNPDLVLQSRVRKYKPELLAELLYTERQLLDGWDKMASIYPTSDWPYFSRHRKRMRERHGQPSNPPMQLASEVLEAIRERGPLSSIDLKQEETIQWSWGQNSRLARASLEILNAMGELVVHHRVGTRRVFELSERALPEELLVAPDPNRAVEDYQNWHVLRRIRGLGLANPGGTEHWLGILGVKSEARRAALCRLVERGDLAAVSIEEIPGRTFFVRAADLPVVEAVKTKRAPKRRAAVIGALDNLMWDRDLLRWVFDFDYVWEVYKPAAKRLYGYYVLPLLYGDRFIARIEPKFDRKSNELIINKWWWEEGVSVDEAMQSAIATCLRSFAVAASRPKK